MIYFSRGRSKGLADAHRRLSFSLLRRDAAPDDDAHPDAFPDGHANAHGHPDAFPDGHADEHTHPNSDTYPHGRATALGDLPAMGRQGAVRPTVDSSARERPPVA